MSPKPIPDKEAAVAVDLSALVEKHEAKVVDVEPFVVNGVGPDAVSVTFANPEDLAWEDGQRAAEAFKAEDLRTVFYILIEDDDHLEAWFGARIPTPVVGEVLQKWMKHYGWDLRRGERMNRAERRNKKK